jgi:hypothetical protein
MALDRTWYNALVDDDGSNAVGTVWNKTQIDNLLDSVDAIHNAHCLVRASAAYPLASGTWAMLSFDVVDSDPFGMRISATSHRVPATGIYGVSAYIQMDANATGLRYIAVSRNGAPFPNYPPGRVPGTTTTILQQVDVLPVTANMSIEIMVHQASGVPLNILADSRLHIWRIA